jgi:hypothetical protein
MSIQLSTAVRNARLDIIEATIGANAVLKIRTGAAPANVAAAATGTVLATLTLPTDWMSNAANGVKALLGTWTDSAADASGTAGYFEICAADGVTRHLQGTVTATGGGGDMIVDNTNFAVGQSFSVTAFSLTDANA